MIRYAPYIDGTIPAFTADSGIRVPFTPNKAVGTSAAAKMALMIKNLDSSYITTLYTEDTQNNIAIFDLPEDITLAIGQYYKVQLAYFPKTEEEEKNMPVLTYSSIGITKYIDSASIDSINITPSEVQYTYSCEDKTETLYNYYFEFNRSDGLKLKYEGQVNNNTSSIILKPNLIKGYAYIYSLTFGTINKYSMTLTGTEELENNAIDVSNLLLSKNEEEGKIMFHNIPTGYKILRFSTGSQEEFLTLSNRIDDIFEFGKEYRYGLIDSNGNYGLKDEIIKSYFEDMFLQDNVKTLKIKFNPKVSSFKKNIQETKVDTLGNKFPYFFRNGDGYYSEFPISGLISYHMGGDFVSASELGIAGEDVPTTNLENYNIRAEKIFREKVFEWLNNGNPKLFRSPTEGNIIVRLMNISLTPEERLGRMIYTFNATAYECSDDISVIYNGEESVQNALNVLTLESLDERYIRKDELDECIDAIDAGTAEGLI